MRTMMPGGVTLRQIASGVLLLALAVFIWYAISTRDKAKRADALESKIEVGEESAGLSFEASENAAAATTNYGRKSQRDREIYDEARQPDADPTAIERVRERPFEAYVEGLCSERRLQRKSCSDLPMRTADD